MFEHVETYMHVYKCEEKNDATNCIPEKVVETLVKINGEDKQRLAKYFSKEEITKDQTTEDKTDLQVRENKGLGEVGNVIYLFNIEDVEVIHNMI
jgi:DNA polymerase/3'-5' exonuclease PolX